MNDKQRLITLEEKVAKLEQQDQEIMDITRALASSVCDKLEYVGRLLVELRHEKEAEEIKKTMN